MMGRDEVGNTAFVNASHRPSTVGPSKMPAIISATTAGCLRGFKICEQVGRAHRTRLTQHPRR